MRHSYPVRILIVAPFFAKYALISIWRINSWLPLKVSNCVQIAMKTGVTRYSIKERFPILSLRGRRKRPLINHLPWLFACLNRTLSVVSSATPTLTTLICETTATDVEARKKSVQMNYVKNLWKNWWLLWDPQYSDSPVTNSNRFLNF